jgi:alpha-1,3-glucosyltransferase
MNNRTYWPLDYPPLTAYHSKILGYLSHKFDEKSVELVKSYGYEEPNHKVFMRLTVIFSDLFTFIIAIVLYVYSEYKHFNFSIKMLVILYILGCPLFILIGNYKIF